jgi:hypothetical protein
MLPDIDDSIPSALEYDWFLAQKVLLMGGKSNYE